MASQRPALEELSTCETDSSTFSGSDQGAVCAVPLFGGEAVAGALLLEAGPLATVDCLLFGGVEQPMSSGQKQAADQKRARQRLFSTPSLLHQLGLAVSVGLGLDGEQLHWLARSLHRVASCDSMNSLVWELCEDVAAHVRRRFIVEAGAVRAALLPRADAQLGLLFHAQPCCSSHACGPSGRGSNPSPTDAGHGAGASQGLPQSVRSGLEYGAIPPAPARGVQHHQSAGQVLTHQPCSKPGVLGSMASRNRLSTLVTSSGAASSDCGTATSRLSKRPASSNLFGEPAAVSGRVMTLFGHAALGGRSTDPQHQLHAAAAASSPPASRTTIVVQLPPHMAAEAPSASLHAQAFPLKHTALQALASAADGGGGGGNIGGTGVGGSFRGTCVEDVALYLQNVHNPSRDVCLLLGCMRGAVAAHVQPGSPRTPLTSPATAPLSPLHPGGGALTSGSATAGTCSSTGSGGAGALQSLVLAGLRLGDSVLAFYICFPRRLPGELLEAVRASCQELLGEVFAGPIRAKLEGSLAAEYETLRATTPGHFAVLRSASVNGLLQSHHRQGPQGSASTRATRLIAPPRGGCGLLLQTKTVTGFSDLSAASPSGAAAAAGVSVGALAAEGGVPYASASKLSRRPSGDLSGASQAEVTLFTALCAARGSSLPRTVSFGAEVGLGGDGAGAGACSAEAGSVKPGRRGASREVAPVTLAHEDLMSVLLQMRQSEAATAYGGSQGGEAGRSASVMTMTVTGVDAGTAGARQQLDLLVSSIHATMTTESNGGMATFTADLESLELLDVLGKGGGGVVYTGRLGTQEVAVKVMELPDVNVGDTAPQLLQVQTQGAGARSLRTGPDADADGAQAHAPNPAAAAAVAKEQLRARRALLRNAMEMAVQGRLSHPNLIQVYATYTNVIVDRRVREDGSAFHCLVPAVTGVLDLGLPAPATVCCAIVAELADCGSLAAALSTRAFPRAVLVPRVSGVSPDLHPFQLDMRGVYMTLLDVALALRHLHSLNLVHRDIKPANLLLKSSPRDHRGFTVKLADFGFVLHLSEVAEDGTRYAMVDQACGTVTHMAPELLPGKARVDASVDVYSFGILMWELLSGGVRPFPHLHPDHIPRHVYKGARPTFGDVVPLAYRGLAHACWSADAHRRPKAADLVTMITAQMQERE